MTDKPRVLIVDDEKGLRLGTKRLLENEDYIVETAENGTEGIIKGTEKEFDLAIIDLKMPDIEGLEVLKEIKKHRPHTICFIATAFASYDTAIEATRLGAYSYIPKPFSPEELLFQLEKGYKQRILLLETENLKREREEQLVELSHEKSRLSAIINTINNGVLVINKTGELVYFNNSAVRLFNLHDVEMGDLILEKLPNEVSELFKTLINESGEKSYSIQLEIKPNRELIVEAFFERITGEDGDLRGVVIAIRNISEFKKIELVRNQFVSMVAHELKTPISAVLGYLRIILDETVNITEEKEEEYQARSIIRLEGLLTLVNDLLDISRMELGTKQREIVELDLKEVINNTLVFLEFDLKKKGIDVNKDFDNGDLLINADNDEITRLFTNLLSNAIKYNKENGLLNIIIDKSKNYIKTQIIDSGIGLKPEEKDKLFQQFFRAKNSKTRGISGTGLGLSIVKQIVETYDGKIEVESEFGKGTTFNIYLPINK
ncbi:MAG: response regulator [Melioribacteraceae bacterium]|nr:response regulator [Melioribacteraceae bacterium]